MITYRSDQHRIQPQIDGLALPVSFLADTCTLGGITVENTYYHGAGMGPAQPAGGLRTPSDITMTFVWADASFPYFVAMYKLAGQTTASVSITPLGINKSVAQKPLTYSGLFGTVTPPEAESQASNLVYLTATIFPNEGVSSN